MNKSRAQNIMMASGKFKQEQEYWLTKLAGDISGAGFPHDRMIEDVHVSRGNGKAPEVLPIAIFSEQFDISREIVSRLGELCNGSESLLSVILLSVLKALIYRYSGEFDPLVVTPVDRQAGTGEYLNTLLILKDNLQPEISFRDLFLTVKETVIVAKTMQNYPYTMLLDELHLPEEELRTGFYLENLEDRYHLNELALEIIFGFNLVGNFTTGILRGEVEYNPAYFAAETVRQIIGHYQRLLEVAVTAPASSVDDVEILSEAERRQVVAEFNATTREFPRRETLHTLFMEQARRTPENPAVVAGGKTLLYCELAQLAQNLAQRLVMEGIGPDKPVALIIEPSCEMLVGILGILQAGGAYLPIDPNYPEERIAYMLEDACVEMLLTANKLHAKVPASFAGTVLALEQLEEELGAGSPKVSAEAKGKSLISVTGNIPATSDNLAYIIYTSGSTGRPKGVMIEHRSVVNMLNWQIPLINLTAADRVSQFINYCFDVSVMEIFPTLLTGATLVIVPTENKSDPAWLAGWLKEERISLCYLPTNMGEMLATIAPELPLRYLLMGGDKMRSALKTTYPIVNIYGPTENTVVSTTYILDGSPTYAVPPIGKPLDNIRAYILDGRLRPVPIGVVGELYLAGEALARGYLNRPELTAERFIADPFWPGERMYKTGDLARWLPDGNIEFMGRIDHQVKIRGFRIEIGEIEATLAKHLAVRAVLVLPAADFEGQTQLLCYLVTANRVKVSELRQYLRQTLPEYMVPAGFIFLEAFPLTSNGKVDRKALPPFENAILSNRENEYIAPETEIQTRLERIWSEVLKVQHIGINDNFLDLGGHSIRATQVIARIYKEFGVQIPVRAFFAAPTIALLAEQIARAESCIYEEITPEPPQEHYPLTHAQKRLWIFDQLTEGTIAYNMPAAFILLGKLDVGALEKAFQTVVARHETLRTRFAEVGGEPVQIVEESVYFSLIYHPELKGEIKDFINEELRTPFDLRKPCLIRASLIQLEAEKYLLLFNMHHIISDAMSINVLASELVQLYNAYLHAGANPLSPLPIQYRDYALWQVRTMEKGALTRQEQYWREKLSGNLTPVHLPYDDIRVESLQTTAAAEVLELSPELMARLRQFAQHCDATPYMALIAAAKILLHKLTGSTDIAIGTSIAGRSQERLEKLIGFFINTLVLRTELAGDPDVRTLLKKVRETTLDAYDNQDYPYDKIVLQREKSVDLFTVMINYLAGTFDTTMQLEGLSMQSLTHEVEEAKFDLSLFVEEIGQSVAVRAVYRTEHFLKESIRNYLTYLQNILTAMVEHPESRLSEIKILAADAYTSILDDFNEDL